MATEPADRRGVEATYRLQLQPPGPDHPGLTFADAADLVDYLAALGVSDLHLSPVLTARSGSTHGYDVVDPTRVSAALGGEAGLRALADLAHAAGLGLVVDIVPNHLGTGAENPCWEALLAEGRAGEGSRFFDVDWDPPLPGAAGKVVLPVLGEPYGTVLHRGELGLVEDDDAVRVAYHEHSFPVSADTAAAVERTGGPAAFAGTPGEPGSWARLHALLERQHYRLVWWRLGDALVNYRRFFAINDLAAVRVEDDTVFERTHATVLRLVADGIVDGLRVDHPDGLRDPSRYLQRLADASGGVWTVVEKISHGPEPGRPEPLPAWPVAGTTGYELCNDVLGLFVDPAAEAAFDALQPPGVPCYARLARQAKAEQLDGDLAADFERLCRRLWALSQTDVVVRDCSLADCRRVLGAVVCALDVYRTYVDPQTGAASPADHATLRRAFSAADDALAGVETLGDWVRRLLAGEAGDSPAHLDFVARWQQLSSAVMAKGVEDTAFYRDRRLLALDEVGGDPARFGITVAQFHAANAARARRYPAGMLTTATHDTKRGEDTRLRIAALSELPRRWSGLLTAWRARGWTDDATLTLVCQTLVGVWPLAAKGRVGPDLRERVRAYLVKALREAGELTSWAAPDRGAEAAAGAALDAMLDDDGFRAEMGALAGAAAAIALVSGLAQVLLRCTSPGVPDTYQGNELWDDGLVDPDNRRPVDFAARRRLLAELDRPGGDPAALWAARRDGRVKLWVLSRALRARRQRPDCFAADAGYEPLAAAGRWADHVVAFARSDAGGRPGAAVVVPRLPGAVMGTQQADPLGERWGDTTVALPAGAWRNAPTGWHDALSGRAARAGRTRVADLLADLPVALLSATG